MGLLLGGLSNILFELSFLVGLDCKKLSPNSRSATTMRSCIGLLLVGGVFTKKDTGNSEKGYIYS